MRYDEYQYMDFVTEGRHCRICTAAPCGKVWLVRPIFMKVYVFLVMYAKVV